MRPREVVLAGLAALHFPGGADTDPPVVIVHGTMDRASGFRRTARHLEDLDVTLFDRRGYAGSRHAGLSPDLASQLDDLEAVLGAISAQPAVVVGHSFGGLLALHLALRVPHLLAAIGCWEPPVPWFAWYRSSVGERARDLARVDDPGAAAEAFMRGMIGDRLWERLPAAMQADRRAEGPALLADLDMARRPGAEVDLGAIEVPTVAGCGGQSPSRFRRSARLVAEGVPGGDLMVVEEANHGAHLSHPAAFAGFVRAAAGRA